MLPFEMASMRGLGRAGGAGAETEGPRMGRSSAAPRYLDQEGMRPTRSGGGGGGRARIAAMPSEKSDCAHMQRACVRDGDAAHRGGALARTAEKAGASAA